MNSLLAAMILTDANKREFSAKERERLASSGAAMSDGSFPIKNESDLRNAIHAAGRAKNFASAKAHIKQRARSLGLTNLLPDNWKSVSKGGPGSGPHPGGGSKKQADNATKVAQNASKKAHAAGRGNGRDPVKAHRAAAVAHGRAAAEHMSVGNTKQAEQHQNDADFHRRMTGHYGG